MASSKWTKWIVGLSGAALFSGFIGYISTEGGPSAAGGSPEPQYPSTGDQSSLSDQWNAQNGGSSDGHNGSYSTDNGGFDRRGNGGGFSGSFGADSGQDSFGGRMRTRAS
jgi:hypothetical protein